MKKIKVMHIINNLGIGGAERVLYLLLEELSKRKDIKITLISLEGHGALEKDFKKLPIKFKKFHYHLFLPIFRRLEPYFRFKLWWFVKKENPDIIHGHLIKGEDFAKVLGALLNKPVVTTSHDCYVHPGTKQKFLNRYLTKGIAVSEPVKKHLIEIYKLPAEKIDIIPDAIRVEDYENSVKEFSKDMPVFMYLGRIIDVKGIQYAIRGLAELSKEYPKMKFLIFGDGWYKKKLEETVVKMNLKFVEFMGAVRDVPSAFSRGDIFILPSRSEGFSMAVLEAIASGKPIIATKTGAIPRMIEEGKNGYFVDYKNSKQIEQAAIKLLNGNIKEMGEVSKKLAKEQFSIEKVSEMYYNLYLKINNEKQKKY